jgi:hypothetical protein
VAVSTTRTRAAGFSEEKYLAAASISASVRCLALWIMPACGPRCGSALLRAPLLKSRIWRTM